MSMVAFVLHETKLWSGNEYESYEIAKSCLKYAQFLLKKLELWMFVPCKFVDGVWVALEQPNTEGFDLDDMYDWNLYDEDCKEYKEAKLLCLFEGFEYQEENKDFPMPFIYLKDDITLYPETFNERDKIEDLVYYSEFITLTPTAQKQIGVC